MPETPFYVAFVFIFTTFATFGFIYFGARQAQTNPSNNTALTIAVFIVVWLFFIAVLALNEFFIDFDSIPPKFLMVGLLPNALVIGLFIVPKSRKYVLKISITNLTYLHIVRVPVEIVLWWLALSGALPLLLTFEGVNHDILSGVSAPFVAIFMVGQRSKSRIGAIIWNFIALGLLINIVSHAVLSAPFPFQQFAFDQPNIAVFYFPYIWLPGFIVPAVLFAHIASLIKLFGRSEDIK